MDKSVLSLSDLWIAWQPIVELKSGKVYGHEALIRGAVGSPFAMPAQIFPAATAQGIAAELEITCRRLAFWGATHDIPNSQHVFINIASHLSQLPLNVPKSLDLHPERLAIEISEAEPILGNQELLQAVQQWRRHGYTIVLDDYGSGYASAATVLALAPQIIKLDRQLVANLDQDPAKQSIVSSVRDYTADLGIKIVGEGIETEAEYRMLKELQVDFGQGYWLARPSPSPRRSPFDLGTTQEFAFATNLTHPKGLHPFDFYREAIFSSPIPSYIVDRRRTIVAWNPAAARLTGYESLLGQKCFDGTLLHQDASGNVICFGACPLVWGMARRRIEGPHLVSFRSADGSRKNALTTVFPIWDAHTQRVIGALEQFQPWPVLDALTGDPG